jgi:acyl-CoA thioesterase I
MVTEQLKAAYKVAEKLSLKDQDILALPVPEDRKTWREDLDPKIDVVRKLAREYHAHLVPLDGIFAQAAALREPAFWASDGVHPSNAGHALIAQAWLRTIKAL